jgi:glycosyltransferase involved in cell wall biosynthesis
MARSVQWRVRVAWFSPMPPVRSGIATCSAELVPALRAHHTVDVYVDEPVAATAPGTRSAHEFVWRHRQQPYDLTVFQVGNSSHHDYLWPYLFRFPGLTVLHDAHLHHARAAALLRQRRTGHYRAEFAANHPEAPDAAELAVAGMDSHLYYFWPMTRLVIEASRLTAVHSRQLADAGGQTGVKPGSDRGQTPQVEYLRLSQGTPVSAPREEEARRRVRAGRNPDAIMFGCFGGLTPEKRLPQILDAFASILPYHPDAGLLLAGATAAHYDLVADVRARSLADRVAIAGYLESDEDLTDCIAAVDVTLNLRWPSAREMSGPWLRSLAAGKPSIVIDLAHTADIPCLDPRTWARHAGDAEPVAVAVDILDEDHSLRLAMRRLAGDADLRRTIGDAGRRYWMREHSPEAMLSDYLRLMEAARSRPAPRPPLPPHLVDGGMRQLESLLAPLGVPSPLEQSR